MRSGLNDSAAGILDGEDIFHYHGQRLGVLLPSAFRRKVKNVCTFACDCEGCK